MMADITNRSDEVKRQFTLDIDAVLQCASRSKIRIEKLYVLPDELAVWRDWRNAGWLRDNFNIRRGNLS